MCRRFVAWSLFTMLAACAATEDSRSPRPASYIPWEERPLSAAVPEFAGKSFDFRCSDCDVPANYCWNLYQVERVIRVVDAVQVASGDTPVCNSNNGHVFPAYCSVRVRLSLAQSEDVYSRTKDVSVPVTSVDATFGYRGDASHVPRFLEPGAAYFLFLTSSPTEGSQPWRLFANCPRTKQSEISDALDAAR